MTTKVINLLPKTRQIELRFEDYFKLVRLACMVTLLTFVLVLVAFLVSRLYLDSQASSIETRTAELREGVNKQEHADLTTKINIINSQIQDYITLRDATPAWADVLQQFAKDVPSGVEITTVHLELKTMQVQVTGFAQKREDVIKLYNNILADTGHFKDIDYPLENVTKPNDVTFHFTFTILPQALKLK